MQERIDRTEQMNRRKSMESGAKNRWKSSKFGQFSFKSIQNLVIVTIATFFIPFFTAGFSFAVFYNAAIGGWLGIQWGFFATSAFKIFMNMILKKTLADHTYEQQIKSDPYLQKLDSNIKNYKDIVGANKLYTELGTHLTIFNEVNLLNAALDRIEEDINKIKPEDIKKADHYFDAEENIKEYMTLVQTQENKTANAKKLQKLIRPYLIGVTADTYDTKSIFSTSSNLKRARKLSHDRKEEIDAKVKRGGWQSAAIVMLVNIVDFLTKDTDLGTWLTAITNTVLLSYSGVTGILIGEEAAEDFKNSLEQKETELHSFLSQKGLIAKAVN